MTNTTPKSVAAAKIMIGHKLRKLRSRLSVSQAEMAAELGISTSYLNLLENNLRPVTVPLLFRLGQTYDIDLRDISEDSSAPLAARLAEIFADPLLSKARPSRREIGQLSNEIPVAAEALITLYSVYEAMRDAAHKGGAANTDRSVPMPIENVREFLEKADNHFSILEEAAEECRKVAKLRQEHFFSDLSEWLMAKYNVKTQIFGREAMGDSLRWFDPHRRRLSLSEVLDDAQRCFQLAAQTAQLYAGQAIEAVIRDSGLAEGPPRELLNITLGGYFAGALMMPYGEFLTAAHECRHDLELLCRRFGASFEQICHRMTTLRRPGHRGIPFFFVRADEAGYISKRLSGGGVELARHGGSCGRWVLHQAFRTPGLIHCQCAELEDGHRLFTIARTVTQPRTGPNHYGTPLFAVALGCELKHVKDIIYADGMAYGKTLPLTPIGMGCSVCERPSCQHRGSPPLGYALQFDPRHRKSGLFDIRL